MLGELLDRRPTELSGGQQQRVALGRAIVRDPEVFLTDEPLSNLDAKLRSTMRTELQRLQEELGVTTMYVTQDQTEAMTMGDENTVYLEFEGTAEPLVATTSGMLRIREGEPAVARIPDDAVHVFDGDTGGALHNRGVSQEGPADLAIE